MTASGDISSGGCAKFSAQRNPASLIFVSSLFFGTN
jgi:hypothetical protein